MPLTSRLNAALLAGCVAAWLLAVAPGVLAADDAAVIAEPLPPVVTPAPNLMEAFTLSTPTIELGGEEKKVDVYRPTTQAVRGVAIVAHGFARTRGRHRELGIALASAGVIAVIPDLPHVMNLWGNGDAIVELARALETGALGLPPVDRHRLLLIGTSAGGLATVLAAAELPGLAGWIGLDPVDRTGTGEAAAEKLTAPAVVLLGDPVPCNLFASGRALGRAAPVLLRMTALPGASHCDFEWPTNRFCEAVCGAGSPDMQARIRDATREAALTLLPKSEATTDASTATAE